MSPDELTVICGHCSQPITKLADCLGNHCTDHTCPLCEGDA